VPFTGSGPRRTWRIKKLVKLKKENSGLRQEVVILKETVE
jgi:hypothetical protein